MGIGAAGGRRAGGPPGPSAAPRLRAARTREWLDALAPVLPGSAAVDALVDLDLGPPDGPHVLAHGDLHLRHLLVLPDGRPSGVIDGGDTCLAVDLCLAYAAFDPASPRRAARGVRPGRRRVRARALAVGLCAGLARAAHATGEYVLLAEYLRGIERATR